MVVRVIDIETTGIDPAADAIIEIASVDLVRGGGVANAKSTYVAPGRQIPPVASAVHHLTDEDVRDAPLLPEVLPMFAGADVYVAHNCEFEQSFLMRHPAWPLTPWVCTYKCALKAPSASCVVGRCSFAVPAAAHRPAQMHRHRASPQRPLRVAAGRECALSPAANQ